MSRYDGFAVMDVSTSLADDPKVRKLWRIAPDAAATAFVAYVATLAESWKAGRRVSVDEAWPSYLPFDEAAAEALMDAELLDSKGFVTMKSWRGWFVPVQKRRQQSRDRWARANAKRTAETALLPRGNSEAPAR